jgi:hypothetical protein
MLILSTVLYDPFQTFDPFLLDWNDDFMPIDWNILPTFVVSSSADFLVHSDTSLLVWSKKKKSKSTMSGYRGCTIHRILVHPRTSLDGFELWAGALFKCTSISLRLFRHNYVNTFFFKSRARDSMKNHELHVTLFGTTRRLAIPWVFQITHKGTFQPEFFGWQLPVSLLLVHFSNLNETTLERIRSYRR